MEKHWLPRAWLHVNFFRGYVVCADSRCYRIPADKREVRLLLLNSANPTISDSRGRTAAAQTCTALHSSSPADYQVMLCIARPKVAICAGPSFGRPGSKLS